MKKHLFYFCLSLLFCTSCTEDTPGVLGDILVRLDPPPTISPNPVFEVGVFPSEILISEEYTANLAIKTVFIEDGRGLITDILPGTYVVALFNTPSATPPRRVVQVVADEVMLVDFDLNPLNNE